MAFGTILFLILMTLKLCHIIDWSWFWVTLPLWVSTVFWAGVIVLAVIND
jgi:hypothetical protein